MDNLPNISPVFWIITSVITTISSIVLGAITWIKSAKLMPKELTKAELENKQAEVTLADRYEELAQRAAEKAVNLQGRLDNHEKDIDQLKLTIKTQSEIITEQSLRLDRQDLRIKDQEVEIVSLVKDLNLAKAYNFALINQMKDENLIPLEISTINIDDYKNDIKPKRPYTKKAKNGNSEETEK